MTPLVPLRFLASVRTGKAPPEVTVDGEVPVYGANGIIGYTDRANTVRPTILVGRVGACGEVTVAQPPCWVTDNALIVDPDSRRLDSRFAVFVLRHSRLGDAASTTAQPLITGSQVRATRIPVPMLEQQRAIADLLDRRTATIDALIAKKERLLEVLRERQRSIVVQAVTRGLDARAKTRDSGIEWLGAIPSHWTTRRTRHVCSLTTGGSDTQDAEDGGAYPFFVRSDRIERINSWSFDGEAVLTSGDGAGVGKVFHHYIGKLDFHQRVYLYYDFRGVLGRFFFYFLREYLAVVALAGNAKSTVDSLRRPLLLDFPIAIPPLVEQVAIVQYLDRALDEQQRAANVLTRQLELLREYREALITAAVSGQLDIQQSEAA